MINSVKYICPKTEFFVSTKQIDMCLDFLQLMYINDLINLRNKMPVNSYLYYKYI